MKRKKLEQLIKNYTDTVMKEYLNTGYLPEGFKVRKNTEYGFPIKEICFPSGEVCFIDMDARDPNIKDESCALIIN